VRAQTDTAHPGVAGKACRTGRNVHTLEPPQLRRRHDSSFPNFAATGGLPDANASHIGIEGVEEAIRIGQAGEMAALDGGIAVAAQAPDNS
jgi:hypothetical protein